jgi:predicted ATP-dependent endonuclease of OLD family
LINKLILKNFKGIKEGEIELSPFTILVGSNNAGKTTILESLFLAPNPVRQVPYGDSAVAVVRKLHETLDSSGYAFLMTDYREKQARIGCQIDQKQLNLDFLVSYENILLLSEKAPNNNFSIKVNGVERPAFASLGLGSNDISQLYERGHFMGDSLLINTSLIESGYIYLKNNWASVMNSGISRKILQEVSGLSLEKYTDLTLEPFLQDTYSLYAFREDGKRIRLGDLGEGIQSYILARMLFELQQPDLLLWDDIESHLNPRILVRLSEWFSDLLAQGKQVVVATHSLEAISLLSQDKSDKVQILLTSMDKNILSSRSLSLLEVENYQESGVDVRLAESLLI